jgi:hypothetical protein
MVDYYGRWTEETDYTTYPKEKWCDYDVMANHLRNTGYEIKTNMENLITMIFLHYECQIEIDEKGYFEIENRNKDGCSLNLADIICYVEASGGIKEFDYEV